MAVTVFGCSSPTSNLQSFSLRAHTVVWIPAPDTERGVGSGSTLFILQAALSAAADAKVTLEAELQRALHLAQTTAGEMDSHQRTVTESLERQLADHIAEIEGLKAALQEAQGETDAVRVLQEKVRELEEVVMAKEAESRQATEEREVCNFCSPSPTMSSYHR